MNVDQIIAQFQLQTDWFVNVLKEISDDESNVKSGTYSNPIKWIAGHLLSSRMTVIEILTGANPDGNYGKIFGKGTTWKADRDYPTIEYITQHWIKIADEFSYYLKKVQTETWHSPAPFQTSIPDSSLGGLIAFFSMHESFHIGQLSQLRKSLGKSTMHMVRIIK